MDLTRPIAKILGPVLLLRAASIVIDRGHFVEMLRGLDREVDTVAFSMFPIVLLVGFLSLALVPLNTRTLAGILLRLIAWGGAVKTSAVILFPRTLVATAQTLGQAGFLNVVLVMSLLVGGYFAWFGYVASDARRA